VNKLQQQKCIIIALLFTLLASYNHCVPKKSANKSALNFQQSTTPSNNNQSDVNVRALSIQAFSETTHNLTKLRCVTCHGSFQQPLHAVDAPDQAYDALMITNKVNFDNIPSSRMVQKLRDGNHNCWSNCEDDASSMEQSLTAWKTLQEELIGSNNNNNSNNNSTNLTSESDFLSVILNPNNAIDNGSIALPMSGAMVAAPMVLANNYIWVPDMGGVNLQNNNAAAGHGYINFRTNSAGSYKLFGLVDAPDGANDSFHLRITLNGTPVTNFFEWHVVNTTGFEWRELSNTSAQTPVAFNLAANTDYSLDITQREDGTKISDVVITDDALFDPINYSPAIKATITYDISTISGIAGTTFQIDVEEFDIYSYKFSNPRINTSTTNIHVKDVKIYINGSYNPQHATYTLVDTIITASNASLSSASLIALKDYGPTGDKISFSFEILNSQ
jgi:hypothetical protein